MRRELPRPAQNQSFVLDPSLALGTGLMALGQHLPRIVSQPIENVVMRLKLNKNASKNIMNQKLLKKFCTIERELSEEKVPFKLFCLCELEEVQGQWDVVMSSKKLPDRDIETLRFVVNKIYAVVSQKEIVKVSRVILLDVDEPFVTQMEQFLETTSNPKELFNCEIGDLKIKHAHIIVSPVKDEAKILVNSSTFNELVNRITLLENERALHGRY